MASRGLGGHRPCQSQPPTRWAQWSPSPSLWIYRPYLTFHLFHDASSHFRSRLRSFLFPWATGVLLVAFPHTLCAPSTSLCRPPTGNLSRLYKPDTSIGQDWTDPRASHKSSSVRINYLYSQTTPDSTDYSHYGRRWAVLDSVPQHIPFFQSQKSNNNNNNNGRRQAPRQGLGGRK
jgi:hypothetical protein